MYVQSEVCKQGRRRVFLESGFILESDSCWISLSKPESQFGILFRAKISPTLLLFLCPAFRISSPLFCWALSLGTQLHLFTCGSHPLTKPCSECRSSTQWHHQAPIHDIIRPYLEFQVFGCWTNGHLKTRVEAAVGSWATAWFPYDTERRRESFWKELNALINVSLLSKV